MIDQTLLSPADALRGLLDDHVHLPGDPGYDEARLAWNVAVDQRPAAVAAPRTAAEVSAVVRLAAECGLRVAPQTTGHNAGPLAARGLDDTILLRTSAMGRVTTDPGSGTVRVEGGAVWEPVVDAAATHGRAVLHGSSPDVGVAGYTLGGGIGWYARRLGLASGSVTAAEVVVGDGTLVRASAQENADLFWALRGGGGSFGVVTALELATFPITSTYAGFLLWDLADAEPVLRTWAAWAPDAPDEVTTSFRAMRFPPLPELPDFLRGRSVAIVDGAVLGSDEHGEALLAALRAHRPTMDTFRRVPASSLLRLHMDPEGGAPAVSDSTVLASLDEGTVEAFLEHAGPDASTSVLAAELRQLGGALARSDGEGGVLDRIDGVCASLAIAMAATPELGARGHADAVRLTDALRRSSTGRGYLNFTENPTEVAQAFPAERWRRLVSVREAVDPHGTFSANHPVG